jgi:hypothetical protein
MVIVSCKFNNTNDHNYILSTPAQDSTEQNNDVINIKFGSYCDDAEVVSDIEYTSHKLMNNLSRDSVIVEEHDIQMCGYDIIGVDTTVKIYGSVTDIDILMIIRSLGQ